MAWLSGTAAPAKKLGANGDYYNRTVNGFTAAVYQKVSGAWKTVMKFPSDCIHGHGISDIWEGDASALETQMKPGDVVVDTATQSIAELIEG